MVLKTEASFSSDSQLLWAEESCLTAAACVWWSCDDGDDDRFLVLNFLLSVKWSAVSVMGMFQLLSVLLAKLEAKFIGYKLKC